MIISAKISKSMKMDPSRLAKTPSILKSLKKQFDFSKILENFENTYFT